MLLLIVGLVLLLGVHSIQIVGIKNPLLARFGKTGYRAFHSVISLAGLVLIVIGYGQARAMGVPQLYDPPAWLRHVNLVLMMIAMVLLAAFVVPGRIKAAVKHPMLAAIKVWALGHLLANGDLASVILFGSFLAWAVIDRIWLKRQPVDVIALEKARAAPAANDLIAVVIGATAFVLFAFWLHPALIGVAVM
ncbi:MAG: NnrU family protein [Rhodobiaceae bacterium]|nr:NnrU family protein [Rhodobiaceae bacterium]MCC0013450.1 NnrU family protein [Rhodobiaceae bacterium]MCC0018261.1 NnrU family protein [Rhodobiaceae bacterium]MCC0060497.1 NnrU family protein [Rhodobiaceae bacterium]